MVAATASAWASPCLDACPLEAAKSDCCAGKHADEREWPPDGSSRLADPLPDCCTGGVFLGCATAADLDAISSDAQSAVPMPALDRGPRLDWTSWRDAVRSRGSANALAPPGPVARTTVMLL
jgi:hypothetical protein